MSAAWHAAVKAEAHALEDKMKKPKPSEVWMTTYQILRFISPCQAQIIDCDLHKGSDGGDCVNVITSRQLIPMGEDRLIQRLEDAE